MRMRMRLEVVVAVLVVVVCAWTTTATAHATTTTVTVRYPAEHLPSKDSMLYIRGSGCGLSWGKGVLVPATGENTWTAKLGCSDAEAQFKILVDDETWQVGANAVAEPGQDTVVTPWFFAQKGSYVYDRNVYSPQLDNTRDVVTYLPPGFYENRFIDNYPFAVMQDGQNLFNASTSFAGVAWDCQATMDVLIVEGAIAPTVLVGVDNTPDRIGEYTPSYDPSVGGGGKADTYLDFVEETVLPLVIPKYRLPPSPTPEQTGIIGSSLGGLLACYAAWTRPHVYGYAGCMSPSFWWDNFQYGGQIMVQDKAPSPRNRVYLDVGSAEPASMQDGFHSVGTHYQALGWNLNATLWMYLAPNGQHSEYWWGKRFYRPMTDLQI